MAPKQARHNETTLFRISSTQSTTRRELSILCNMIVKHQDKGWRVRPLWAHERAQCSKGELQSQLCKVGAFQLILSAEPNSHHEDETE